MLRTIRKRGWGTTRSRFQPRSRYCSRSHRMMRHERDRTHTWGDLRPDLTRWLRVCAWAFLMVLFSTSAGAAARRVVLLQSFERGNVVLDQITSTLRVVMDERSADPVTFIEFVVNPAGFRAIPEEAMVDYLRSAFAAGPKPDLVIAIGGPAAAFARVYRRQLFPDSPMLYGPVDQRFLRNASLSDQETAVAVANDPILVVNNILQLFPDTQTVF